MPRSSVISTPGPTVRVLLNVEVKAERDSLTRSFRRLGHEVTVFASIEEAWLQLASQSCDILYVDLASQTLDTLALIRDMGNHPRTKFVPVVVLCPRDNSEKLITALEAGASGFLGSPLEMDLAITNHEIVLRRARRVASERVGLAAAEAGCRVREAFLAGACSEAVGYARQILDTAAAVVAVRAPSDEGAAKSLQQIAADALVLVELVEQAQDKARRVADVLTVADKACRIDRLIGQAVAPQAGLARRRRVKISVRPLPPGTQVLCDEEALSAAIAHLVANAVAAAPASSVVDIEVVVHPDGMLSVAVTDQGAGIAPEFVVRCLNPLAFDGAFMPARRHIGSGLPMAKALAEAHGGRLEIRTYPGDGTTAMLTVPPGRVVTPVRR